MKKLSILLLSGCMLIAMASCKKSSSGGSGSSGNGTGTITGTGGATFSVAGNNTFFQKKLPNTTGNITSDTLISLLGTISASPVQGINIQLYDISSVGTYSLSGVTSPSSAAIVYNYGDSSYTSILAVSPGTVTISAITASSITGTYTTTVSTVAHTNISISGTFTGNY
jgi:hypothetical protein